MCIHIYCVYICVYIHTYIYIYVFLFSSMFHFVARLSAVRQQPHMQSTHAFTTHQVAKNATRTAQKNAPNAGTRTHQQFTKPKPDTSIRDR